MAVHTHSQGGDAVSQGDIIGTVPETNLIEHRIMVPPGIKGTIKEIRKGDYTVEEPVAWVEHDGK
jgi:V/A-type H+/Na+-transporting ATPase subunit A